MSHQENIGNAGRDQQVETACGGIMKLTSDLPSTIFKGETVYFCGQGCKQLYESDPLNSCLAYRILTGK